MLEALQIRRAEADYNSELLQAIKTDTTAGMDTIKEGVAGLQVREDGTVFLEFLGWKTSLTMLW